MKIEVRNLGVITEAQIDLKPLTIFVGPNNAGKTWLAYTLAGILGDYGREKYVKAYINGSVQDTYPSLEATIQQVLAEGNAKFDIVQFAEVFGETYFNNVARYAKQWMKEYWSTETVSFQAFSIHIALAGTKARLLERVTNYTWESNLGIGISNRNSLLRVLKEQGKREIYIYTSTEENLSEKLPLFAIREFLVNMIVGALNHALYSYVCMFPTERTSLTSILTNRLALQEVLHKTRSTKPLIEPVRHFSDMIVDLFNSSLSEREKDTELQAYIQLAQVLEEQILRGSVRFSTPEPDPFRTILFLPDQQTTLDISISSSMVKELSALVLYLRYIAKPGDWLIIDEPEMNLHPEAQARFTEFLAMLIQADLQILLTTHSPYILDHLANLMKGAESTEPDTIKEKFYLQRKEAFISKGKVSVYLVDKGKTENILDEDGVIHWDTFSGVSDRVTEIYFEI